METAEFAFDLPPDLVAQEPVEPRDAARLLVADPLQGGARHLHVRDLPSLLRPGDLLVLNRTRVIPARLEGRKDSGGAVEVLLVHAEDGGGWRCLVGGKVRPGTRIAFAEGSATVAALHEDGTRSLDFHGIDVIALADRIGHMPLPPYIRRADRADDRGRYQTVFADRPGSVAAPTASLHLTTALLEAIAALGVATTRVELRIGPGTFKPVDTERVEDFRIHAEWAECPPEACQAIAACRARGGRVIAVGTTVVRTLESAAGDDGTPRPWSGWTRLFLHPPQRLRTIDGLLTNFHLPRSSLLMLVACLVGTARLRDLYRTAIAERYRFFSYGDAMLLLPGAVTPASPTGAGARS